MKDKSTLLVECLAVIGMIMFASGCFTEFNLATQREEVYLHSTEKEIKIGDKVALKVEAEYDMVEDVDVNERIERIKDRIAQVSDRRNIVYFIKVIDDEKINAVSLPGGYVYIFKGLYDKLENDDQLAGVIAHEIAHITARHGMKRLQNSYGALLLQVLAVEAGGEVSAGANFALTSIFMEHSQQAEFEADRLGVKYLKKAGFDEKEMIKVLEILQKEKERAPIRRYSYWRTHPHIPKRLAVVHEEIYGAMDFKGYLNITGEEGW